MVYPSRWLTTVLREREGERERKRERENGNSVPGNKTHGGPPSYRVYVLIDKDTNGYSGFSIENTKSYVSNKSNRVHLGAASDGGFGSHVLM